MYVLADYGTFLQLTLQKSDEIVSFTSVFKFGYLAKIKKNVVGSSQTTNFYDVIIKKSDQQLQKHHECDVHYSKYEVTDCKSHLGFLVYMEDNKMTERKSTETLRHSPLLALHGGVEKATATGGCCVGPDCVSWQTGC